MQEFLPRAAFLKNENISLVSKVCQFIIIMKLNHTQQFNDTANVLYEFLSLCSYGCPFYGNICGKDIFTSGIFCFTFAAFLS